MSNDTFDDFTKVAKLVSLKQIINIDSSVTELADMETGYFAHRKFKGDNWIIEKIK